jgi:hypothetical protein
MAGSATHSTLWNGVERYMVTLRDGRLWVSLGVGPAALQLLSGVPYEQVWLGCSPLNETTAFSGGHGPDFDANALLFRLPASSSLLSLPAEREFERRHLFVGSRLYAFDWPVDDPVERFVSSVGNSCVPYPYAVTPSHALFFLDATALPRAVIGEEVAACPTADLYEPYYDFVALHQARLRPPLSRAPLLLNPRQRALEPNPAFEAGAVGQGAGEACVRGLALRFVADDGLLDPDRELASELECNEAG